MKKKIGILTFHYANNYGAVLQTYALRRVINSFSTCHAEIINYVPTGYSYPISCENRMIEIQKRKKFRQFLSEQCGIHTPIIHSVTGNEYDIYLVGSDQIWNTDISLVEADYEYFLPHLNDAAKRIAYSASIGMDFEKINRDLFQKYLPKYNSISVREKSYVDIVSVLSGKKCEYTLDPTFLLDERDYEEVIETPDTVKEPYLLYFYYGADDDAFSSLETVNMLARKYGLSIKHTFSSKTSLARQLLVQDAGDIMQSGIGEFLWYVKNAQIVVTNSFHGAVFSILFKRPFYIYYSKIRSCRQRDLADILGIQNRVIKGYLCPDKLNLEVDYANVFLRLEKEKERSINYLKNAIDTI